MLKPDWLLSKKERKHLILTGKNGSGKTSVLKSIKSFLKSIEEKVYHYVLDADRQIGILNKVESVNNLPDSDINRAIEAIAHRDPVKYWENIKLRYNSDAIGLYFNFNSDLVDKYNAGEFILDYFDADRMTNVQIPNGVEKTNFDEKYTMDSKPSSMFLKYLVDLKTQQAFARNENDMDVVEKIDKWFNRFENSLKFLMDDESVQLKFDYKNYNFEILLDHKNSIMSI